MYFRHTDITGKGLKHLKGLNRLQELDLGGTRMGDRNVEYLALFEKLEKLYVEDTYLTDEGLEHLHKLKSLRELDCSWNKHITDGGVKFLAKLTQLKSLDVSRTAISSQGLEELRRALPKTKVD